MKKNTSRRGTSRPYEKNKLYSQKAEYSNSEKYVIISKDVKVESDKGNLYADNLFFDMQKGTLNVSALNNKKVNVEFDVRNIIKIKK